MSQTTSARTAARTFVFVGAFVAVLGVAAACSEARRSNGDSCLKDEDCLSGICAGQVCTAAAPILDATYDADTGATKTDASEAAADTAPAKDTSTPKEAAAEAASEAASDTGTSSDTATGDGAGDGAGD